MAVEILFTSLVPGLAGNLITLNVSQPDPSIVDFSLTSITDSDYLQVDMEAVVGFTSSVLNAGTWADIETLYNATDAAAVAPATEGTSANDTLSNFGSFSGGGAGAGLGSFYLGSGIPAPPAVLTQIYPFSLPKRFCVTHPCCTGHTILAGKNNFYVQSKPR